MLKNCNTFRKTRNNYGSFFPKIKFFSNVQAAQCLALWGKGKRNRCKSLYHRSYSQMDQSKPIQLSVFCSAGYGGRIKYGSFGYDGNPRIGKTDFHACSSKQCTVY